MEKLTSNNRRWIRLMEYGQRIGCHQKPERSFFHKGYQFPVCARCTGVVIGEIIAILLLIFRIRLNIIVSLFLLFIMGIDWFIQFINILQSTNKRRLISGFCGGIGLTYIYYYISIYILESIFNYICE